MGKKTFWLIVPSTNEAMTMFFVFTCLRQNALPRTPWCSVQIQEKCLTKVAPQCSAHKNYKAYQGPTPWCRWHNLIKISTRVLSLDVDGAILLNALSRFYPSMQCSNVSKLVLR